MPGYISAVEVYYTKFNEPTASNNRIAPAPAITISPEIYYANDNPIGYTYKVTLKGYANALRKELNAGSTNYGLEPVLDHMGDIRKIFSFNGGDLHVYQNNGDIILAKGATVKNIKFDPSDNKWVNYAPFTIELEFNEVNYGGCSSSENIGCNNSIFHQTAGSKNINDKLVDITDYKIKAFNDKWTFTIDEKIYEQYENLKNNYFNVTYNISATGKHYYVNGNLVPAWQQAKLFVQHRLRSQVINLINGVLQIENNNKNSCVSTKSLKDIYGSGVSGGAMQNFTSWDIYNEYITCETSEAEGTFNLVYNAIIKKDSAPNLSANAVLHTYSKEISTSATDKLDANITVKGTIQGLIKGGFIHYDFNHFSLPSTGSFITAKDGSETKYGNAYAHYTAAIGDNNDLLDQFKNDLKITKTELLVKNDDGIPPKPASFSIDHSYSEGSLGYTAVYNRLNTIGNQYGYTNISIVRKDPTEIIQEFIVPGRAAGPIIQKLNMKKARTISINIDGASKENKGCSIDDLCNALPIVNIQGLDKLLIERNDLIKTKEEYTSNKIDGSFSISLEYISKG